MPFRDMFFFMCLGGLVKRTPLKGIKRGRQEKTSSCDQTVPGPILTWTQNRKLK